MSEATAWEGRRRVPDGAGASGSSSKASGSGSGSGGPKRPSSLAVPSSERGPLEQKKKKKKVSFPPAPPPSPVNQGRPLPDPRAFLSPTSRRGGPARRRADGGNGPACRRQLFPNTYNEQAAIAMANDDDNDLDCILEAIEVAEGRAQRPMQPDLIVVPHFTHRRAALLWDSEISKWLCFENTAEETRDHVT